MVGDQVVVDDVGQVSFEASSGFLGGLGLGELALVVGLPGAGVADLADRDDVQRAVELAVVGAVEPVAAQIAAGGLDRRGAGGAGVVVAVGEAADVTGVAEDLGGQDRAEAVDLGEGRAAGGDGLADCRGGNR
jgi:hypothetical protein